MPKAKSDTTDDVTELKRQLAEANARASSAEGEASTYRSKARDAELSAMSADERALVSQQEATDSNLTALESEMTGYENEIAALADEPGHGKEIAALNRKLASTAAKVETETNRKTYLAGLREQAKGRTASKTAEHTASDTAEKVADGTPLNAFGAPTQAWLKARPAMFTDRRLFKTAKVAAIEAIEVEGLADQSPEYFRFIEAKIGEGQQAEQEEDQEEGEEVEAQEQQEQRRPGSEERYEPEKPQHRAAGPGAMSAAPPSSQRLAPSGDGKPTRKPALSSQEREVADALYSSERNPAERYRKYAHNRDVMNGREPAHFMPRN